jgi:hypothetical protein
VLRNPARVVTQAGLLARASLATCGNSYNGRFKGNGEAEQLEVEANPD